MKHIKMERAVIRLMIVGAALTVSHGAGAGSAGVQTLELLKAFENPPRELHAEVIEGSDGGLYGTTWTGGSHGAGIIFKVNRDGTGFLKLHDFDDADTANGAYPRGGLLEASDGTLYGNATGGGAYGHGVVFKLNRDGTGFLKLHDFNRADTTNGSRPEGELIEGSDGTLYGTAPGGGAYGWGLVFRIKKDGTGFLKLHDFNLSYDGGGPIAGVTEGSDGALYGTTVYDSGVFRVNKDGSGFVELFDLSPGDGQFPWAAVVEGSDGNLYGTTSHGGAFNGGVVFRVSKTGSSFLRVHDFSPSVGAFPLAGLLLGSNNSLYGTTNMGGAHGSGILFRISRASVGGPPVFQTLHDFDFKDAANGSHPVAGVVEGSDGTVHGTALYGTTSTGGLLNAGTIFKINKNGADFVKLHDFRNSTGSFPHAGLVETSDGALYGTTRSGGVFGSGVVFKVSKDGSAFLKVHDFDRADPGNGAFPEAELIQGSDGALYGTTSYGGIHDSGIVFKLNSDGSGFLNLHDFNRADAADGANPEAGLVEGSDGALYGTTRSGGTVGSGIVFRLNRDGTGFLKLHDFNGIDGAGPSAQLIEGLDSALYGTTVSPSTIFRVNKDGTGFLKLHRFSRSDGLYPYAGLVQGPKGALYGTASAGGPDAGGVVFALVP